MSPVRGHPAQKIRAESPSNGSDVRPAGLTPHKKSTPEVLWNGDRFLHLRLSSSTSTLEPIRAESTVVPFLSSGTSLRQRTTCGSWARNQCFVMGCPEQVQHTMMDGHVSRRRDMSLSTLRWIRWLAIAGPPGRQYWGARMSTSAANRRFTIPPTGCVHLDALWCGLCTRWPVPYFLTGSTLRRP